MFGILSHTYRYKVTSWSHNLVIAHTVFDSGSLAGILMSEPTAKSYVKRTCMFVLSIATFTFTRHLHLHLRLKPVSLFL